MAACGCPSVKVIRGDEEIRRATAHMTLLPDPDPRDEEGPTGYGSEWADWVCEESGQQWYESEWGGSHELRRRPSVSRRDYLDAHRIHELAHAVSEAHDAVHRHHRVNEVQWHLATEQLWFALEALYSSEWRAIVDALRRGEIAAVEPAVVFLEADPRCFRSGYQKEQLCRYLRRLDLPHEAEVRLRAVAKRATVEPARPRRERRAYELLLAALDATSHT